MKNNKNSNGLLWIFGIIIILVIIYTALWGEDGIVTKTVNRNRIVVLSSYENKVSFWQHFIFVLFFIFVCLSLFLCFKISLYFLINLVMCCALVRVK